MHRPIHLSTATLSMRGLTSRSPLHRRFPLVLLALGLFALSPTARAVDPPPDGDYGNGNTAEGLDALFSLTTGGGNTAVGGSALYSNTTGEANTATGGDALYGNTTGNNNTANGAFALLNNTTGNSNTATGFQALYLNATGSNNTANGAFALAGDLNGTAFNTGSNNTATGVQALFNNTTGNSNTANGFAALKQNTTGFKNTANGVNSLLSNKTGSGNTAEGDGALLTNTGSFNIAVGFNAGANLTTGHDNIDIGAAGVAGESNTMRIGTVKQTATFITGIRGAATINANAVPVVIDSAGQLGTISSSQRFKDEIEPMDNASEAIMSLKPVRFHYKSDKQNTPQFGLIAEEVAKVDPNLVVRDEKGEIYTVRYEAVNAMLLNEFLKEHRKVETLEATVIKQQEEFHAKIAQQQKQIEALTAIVQKVSDQIALGKPAPQLVTNP